MLGLLLGKFGMRSLYLGMFRLLNFHGVNAVGEC